MSETQVLTPIDSNNTDEFAIYRTSSDQLTLQNDKILSLPSESIDDKAEVWFFFQNTTDSVSIEIKANWSAVPESDILVSGGKMYAYTNYHKKDLPIKKNRHKDNTPNPLATCETKMPVGENRLLSINKAGITAVRITVWELGDCDNDIRINNVFYKSSDMIAPSPPTGVRIE